MSADFLLTACPAPLAKYSSSIRTVTVTNTDIAPESTWRGPLQRWLEKPETINTIMETVDAYVVAADEGWGSFVLEKLDPDNDPTKPVDPGLEAYCLALNDNPVIDLDTVSHNAYARTVIKHISEHFMDAAYSAFADHNAEGTVYNGEFITAGMSWGDVPTEIFDDVALLSWIDFFKDYPIAVIVDDKLTGWVDHDGNPVPAP